MTSAREERRSYLRIWATVAWLSLETGRGENVSREVRGFFIVVACVDVWGQGAGVGKVDGKKRIWKLWGARDPSRGSGWKELYMWEMAMERRHAGRQEGRWVGFGTWGKGLKAPTSSLPHSPRKRRRLSFENWTYHWLSPKTFSTQIILLLNHRDIPGGPTLSIIIHLQFSFAFTVLHKIRCKLCFREWLGDTKFWLIEKCKAWHVTLIFKDVVLDMSQQRKRTKDVKGGRRVAELGGSAAAVSWCWVETLNKWTGRLEGRWEHGFVGPSEPECEPCSREPGSLP